MTDATYPTLTDGTVVLRPLEEHHAAAHLAGEDSEQQKWLSGGISSLDGVRRWILEGQRQWFDRGPRRTFGVFSQEDVLMGMAEVNLAADDLGPGAANISYGIYPAFRGQGLARRSALLLFKWLERESLSQKAIIQVDPRNVHSLRIPQQLGFRESGTISSEDGPPRIRFERVVAQQHSLEANSRSLGDAR